MTALIISVLMPWAKPDFALKKLWDFGIRLGSSTVLKSSKDAKLESGLVDAAEIKGGRGRGGEGGAEGQLLALISGWHFGGRCRQLRRGRGRLYFVTTHVSIAIV